MLEPWTEAVLVEKGDRPGCSGSPAGLGGLDGRARDDPGQVSGRLDEPCRPPPGREWAARAVARRVGAKAGGPLVRQLAHDVGVGGGEHGLLLGSMVAGVEAMMRL
jgi:hypothetical protein